MAAVLKGSILLFPMLTSGGISSNIIPGIAKTLELFTITYKINDIINMVNKSKKIKMRIKNKKLVSESVFPNSQLIISDMIIKEQLRSIAEAGPGSSLGNKEGVDYEDDEDIEDNTVPKPATSEKPKSGERVSTTDFKDPDTKSISVQPTWIKVDTPQGSAFLGIKVVPIRFKDEEKAMKFLEDDYSRNLVLSYFVKWGRSTGRVMWNIWYKTLGGILGRPAPSGIVKKDIIMARTSTKKNSFVLFNFLLLKNAFLDDAGSVSGLFAQKWSSIIAADDQNKIAYFCMKEFGGICSQIPYSLIYSSLSKEAAKSFSELEDARKTSSALFSRKIPYKKMLKKK